MVQLKPFAIFGTEHLATLLLIFIIITGVPFFFRGKDKKTQWGIGIGIACLIFVHEITNNLYYNFTLGLNWQEMFPLHMCDLSALAIALYFFNNNKLLFNCAFFWGISGASMALLTPDIEFGPPSSEYWQFFYGHTLVLLGVFYAVIALEERPYLKDVFNVIKVTLVLLAGIYIANFILGEDANFWYLKKRPDGASLLDLFPDPPFHILVTIPLAVVMFYLIYLPLGIKDWITKNK
ncbi:MAG: TIGR02206 family membrane protein [Gammaproteobacteria bacterium]